jgi:hypothetical protein
MDAVRQEIGIRVELLSEIGYPIGRGIVHADPIC